jgi:hypothetical protein
MLYQFVNWLPHDAGTRGFAVAFTIAAVGLGLSVAGARFSRSIFTLAAVAGGAWAGLRVPRWMGWELDPMATGIGAALVMGMAGYLLHRAWVGLTLGLMLASMGLAITWHRLATAGSPAVPTIDLTHGVPAIVREFWAALPRNWSRILLIVAGTGLAGGAMIAWVWPRAARVLAFSMMGTAMLAGGGVVAVAFGRPEWLARVPASVQTQGIALAILFVVSAAVQAAMMPRVKRDAVLVRPPGAQPRGPRDVRDLGSTPLGPIPKKSREAA